MGKYRKQLLQAQDPKSLHKAMNRLPKLWMHEQEEEEDALENVIATALVYIRLYPPKTLLSDNNPTMPLLPPTWTTVSKAPTDWTLLQQAKALREAGSGDCTMTICMQNDETITSGKIRRAYPLAVAALALPSPQVRKRRAVLLVVVVMILVAVGGLMSSFGHGGVVLKLTPSQQDISPASSSSLWTRPRTTVTMTSRAKNTASPHRRATVVQQPQATVLPQPNKIPAAVSNWVQSTFNHGTSEDALKHEHHGEKKKVRKWLEAAKQWKKNHFTKESLSKWGRRAVVESDKLRWKGQRFLL